MSIQKLIIEDRQKNGSLEEQLFIGRLIERNSECPKILSEALRALQSAGLSAAEIKGAFEFSANTCGIFIRQQ